MRKESVSKFSTFRVSGAGGRLHPGHAEIVFSLDIGTVDFGHLNRAGELFILRFEFNLYGLIAVAIDHIQHERAVVVACGC